MINNCINCSTPCIEQFCSETCKSFAEDVFREELCLTCNKAIYAIGSDPYYYPYCSLKCQKRHGLHMV